MNGTTMFIQEARRKHNCASATPLLRWFGARRRICLGAFRSIGERDRASLDVARNASYCRANCQNRNCQAVHCGRKVPRTSAFRPSPQKIQHEMQKNRKVPPGATDFGVHGVSPFTADAQRRGSSTARIKTARPIVTRGMHL